jgi:hypothetical protein
VNLPPFQTNASYDWSTFGYIICDVLFCLNNCFFTPIFTAPSISSPASRLSLCVPRSQQGFRVSVRLLWQRPVHAARSQPGRASAAACQSGKKQHKIRGCFCYCYCFLLFVAFALVGFAIAIAIVIAFAFAFCFRCCCVC